MAASAARVTTRTRRRRRRGREDLHDVRLSRQLAGRAVPHRREAQEAATQCLTCHIPHAAKVDASDCTGCHESVRARRSCDRRCPSTRPGAATRERSTGAAYPSAARTTREAPTSRTLLETVDAFVTRPRTWGPSPTRRRRCRATPLHRPCTTSEPPHPRRCHHPPRPTLSRIRGTRKWRASSAIRRHGIGRLTFERPRGCTICHHQESASARCASCHQEQELAAPRKVTATVAVPDAPRPGRWISSMHAMPTGSAWSATPLRSHSRPHRPSPSARTATPTITRPAAPVRRATPSPIRRPPMRHSRSAHQRCDACHTPRDGRAADADAERSAPHATRPRRRITIDSEECSACHFLAEPGAYRASSPSRRDDATSGMDRRRELSRGVDLAVGRPGLSRSPRRAWAGGVVSRADLRQHSGHRRGAVHRAAASRRPTVTPCDAARARIASTSAPGDELRGIPVTT